jgi:hypothetical protein
VFCALDGISFLTTNIALLYTFASMDLAFKYNYRGALHLCLDGDQRLTTNIAVRCTLTLAGISVGLQLSRCSAPMLGWRSAFNYKYRGALHLDFDRGSLLTTYYGALHLGFEGC